ncbi:MAG TPA: hypothetical protein VL020_00960 [Pseudomonadales bacterium]|nr:hypothetical protein [Pseudomonadales bacterium]
MKTRITQLSVAPEGADLYDDRSTIIEIVDEGGGEFIAIMQPHMPSGCETRINTDEWPAIRAAVNKMIKECKE